MTRTRAQSMEVSSGSVTLTRKGTVSPNEKSWPSAGSVRLTVGAVFPTVTMTPAVAVLAVTSVTVSVAVYCPLVAYVCAGLASLEVPPSPKLHAYDNGPPSGSLLPADENATGSGPVPDVRSAAARAIGARPPGEYSMR